MMACSFRLLRQHNREKIELTRGLGLLPPFGDIKEVGQVRQHKGVLIE